MPWAAVRSGILTLICFQAFKRTAIDNGILSGYKNAKDAKNSNPRRNPMPMLNGKRYPELVMANTIDPKEINWLWWPYIPAGSASMIFGPGGTGKSHIAVDIAARISQGQVLPNQKVALPAQNVLILSAEDEFDRVLVPRLTKAGADLTKIAFPKAPFTLDKDGLAMMEQYMTAFTAGIVFIDPVVAYIGGKIDINKANETREFTGGLHQMAMRTGAAIIVVHHARKGAEGADYERMMGSADFNNAVRSVMYTTQAPNGDRIVRHVKANYAALGPTLGYEFGEEGFHWTGTYQEDGTKARSPGKQLAGSIQDWLRETLAKGPVPAVVIEREATKQDWSHRTMVRAKAGVAESFLVSKEGKAQWYWRLKDQANGDGADVPVMGVQWNAERKDRNEREIIAREEERALEAASAVGGRGPKGPKTDVDLDQWVKENL